MRSKVAALLALGCLAAPVASSTQPLSEEAKIFQQVCLRNAPALDEGAISAAAQKVTYGSAGGMMGAFGGMSGVRYDGGRECQVSFPSPRSGSVDAELQQLAIELAGMIGAEKVETRVPRIGKKIPWYQVENKSKRLKFAISGENSNGSLFYWITKR